LVNSPDQIQADIYNREYNNYIETHDRVQEHFREKACRRERERERQQDREKKVTVSEAEVDENDERQLLTLLDLILYRHAGTNIPLSLCDLSETDTADAQAETEDGTAPTDRTAPDEGTDRPDVMPRTTIETPLSRISPRIITHSYRTDCGV
jgi:hypothetical protein